MLCVVCGKNEATIGALCEECYIKKHRDIIKRRTKTIKSCHSCGRIKYAAGWVDRYDPQAKEVFAGLFSSAYGPLEVDIVDVEYNHMTAIVDAAFTIHLPEGDVHLKRTEHVKLEKTLCPRCRSRHAESYAMRIQLRGNYTSAQYAAIMQKVIEFQDREDVSVKVSRERGGFVNIDVDTIKNGDDIVQSILGVVEHREVIESYQLRGAYRDGRKKYHKTTVIRVMEIRPGMMFTVGSRKITVEKVKRGKIHFRVKGEGKYVMDRREFEKLVGLKKHN